MKRIKLEDEKIVDIMCGHYMLRVYTTKSEDEAQEWIHPRKILSIGMPSPPASMHWMLVDIHTITIGKTIPTTNEGDDIYLKTKEDFVIRDKYCVILIPAANLNKKQDMWFIILEYKNGYYKCTPLDSDVKIITPIIASTELIWGPMYEGKGSKLLNI